jgi:hypothetical protein
MFERLYFLVALILTVIVFSKYTVATVIMLLIVATPTLTFGCYLMRATYVRRNLLGSSAYIVPFVFGVVQVLISIKCLTVIYSVI